MIRSKTYDFGFPVRPALRLREVERILRATRVITPVPSRPTLIKRLEEGTLEGRKLSHGWEVFEDSFKAWVRSLQPEGYEPVAPSVAHLPPASRAAAPRLAQAAAYLGALLTMLPLVA